MHKLYRSEEGSKELPDLVVELTDGRTVILNARSICEVAGGDVTAINIFKSELHVSIVQRDGVFQVDPDVIVKEATLRAEHAAVKAELRAARVHIAVLEDELRIVRGFLGHEIPIAASSSDEEPRYEPIAEDMWNYC